MKKVNVLFVCGYGVGSSAISEIVVNKALKELSINTEVKHTSVGEMRTYAEWANIIAISKKLIEGVEFKESDKFHVIEVVNIMDGKGIAGQIKEIVDKYYPEAIGI